MSPILYVLVFLTAIRHFLRHVPEPPPVQGEVGAYTLVDHRGQPFGSRELEGKVYVANDDSDVVIFAHGRNKKVLAKKNMDAREIHATPVAVSGELYVATDSKLYAISAP